MRFLVTGGAGFIGSHIVERLLNDGHDVRVLDNFSSGKEENLLFTHDYTLIANRYTLISGDIRDKLTCNTACKGIDYVLHQAGLRSVPKSMTRPHEYNDVNITGTVNMMQAAVENKVKRFVYASSSSVYGEAKTFPQKETDPSYLISPYALTKLADEHYARIFSMNNGLETVGLRYFNVFGPRQAMDDEYAVVIPKFINCLLDDKEPPIYGNGKQSRDFSYIDNVVDANILAATASPSLRGGRSQDSSLREGRSQDSSLRGGPEGRRSNPEAISKHSTLCDVFNVAGGREITILQLVEMLNKIMCKDIKPTFLPIRKGDIFRTCADMSSIKAKLGFVPKVSFEDGLRKTVEWFEAARMEAVENTCQNN